MLKTILFVLLAVWALTVPSQKSFADILIIERITADQSVSAPSRGMTMTQVSNTYGEPVSKNPAVGEPPITVWEYDEYSVYFEKKWVIKSVLVKSTDEEKGPKKATQEQE